MAATFLLAHELCARLHIRRKTLQHLAILSISTTPEPAWWHWHASLSCWWMSGMVVFKNDAVHVQDPRGVSFCDSAEALVLLRALARVDPDDCLEQLYDLWSCVPDELGYATGRSTRPTVPRRLELGLTYHVSTADDFAPISERVFGLAPCSETFLREYAWLQHAFKALESGTEVERCGLRPLPVRLHVNVRRQQTDELTYLLRQILQAVIAQHLYARTTSDNDDDAEAAAASARFEIVEVYLQAHNETTANVEALALLARLVALGVRVRRLPAIGDIPGSVDARLSIVHSLQVLVPPCCCLAPSSQGVEYVFATKDIPWHLVPAVFSAIQASASLKRVEFLVEDGVGSDGEDDVQVDVYNLWKWAAYALFSRHAQNNIECVVLHVDGLDARVLRRVVHVLQVENPLTVLFDGAAANNCWIKASLFYLQNLEYAIEGEGGPLYRSPQPLRVRVIDRCEGSWRVLLPGLGGAWVKDADARTEPPPSTDEKTAAPVEPLPLRLLKLEGFVASNKNETLSVLRLVQRDILGIEVETVDSMDDGFDMTDWTQEVLRLYPSLERLSLPWNAEIDRLQIFVDAAEIGHGRLQYLSLNHNFYAESTDVLAFFKVLADIDHPLTRTLEELSLHVSAREAPFEDKDNLYLPIEEFTHAWQRVLQHNRKLHTISLLLLAPTDVETDERPVAIRTGPLCIQSKLAFLSLVHHPNSSDRALGRFDTGVIATIFAFAAPHRVRTFDIDFDPY